MYVRPDKWKSCAGHVGVDAWLLTECVPRMLGQVNGLPTFGDVLSSMIILTVHLIPLRFIYNYSYWAYQLCVKNATSSSMENTGLGVQWRMQHPLVWKILVLLFSVYTIIKHYWSLPVIIYKLFVVLCIYPTKPSCLVRQIYIIRGVGVVFFVLQNFKWLQQWPCVTYTKYGIPWW